jgi:hypothetical protein
VAPSASQRFRRRPGFRRSPAPRLGSFNDDDLLAFAAAITACPLPERRLSGLTSGPGGQGTGGLDVAQVIGGGQLAAALRTAITSSGAHLAGEARAAAGSRMVLLNICRALRDFAAPLLAAVEANGGTARLLADELS